MIVFMLITFGWYYPVWFFRRRAALNRLSSPRKLKLWRALFAERVTLSGLMTFFFQIFYLQHVINREIAVVRREAV
jgi:hypothetical protein